MSKIKIKSKAPICIAYIGRPIQCRNTKKIWKNMFGYQPVLYAHAGEMSAGMTGYLISTP